MSRGTASFKGFPVHGLHPVIQVFCLWLMALHRPQSQNPHGQCARSHLLYSPAYILRHLQSDKLLQWLLDYFSLRQDKGKFPFSRTGTVLSPGICRTVFPYLIVIYAPCPTLLSSFLSSFRKHLNKFSEKETWSVDSFHLQGMRNTAAAEMLADNVALLLGNIRC